MAAGIPIGGMPPGGAPGGGAPGGAAPNPISGLMALIGKAGASSNMAGGDADIKMAEQAMAIAQQLSNSTRTKNPKAYASFLRGLQAMHAGLIELKNQPPASGPPLTSSMLSMIAPSSSMANPLGGGNP
jgi:hypothetical protein